MGSARNSERRGETRWPRHLPVRFGRAGEELNQVGFTTNLSTTGLFIATRSVVPPGTRVRLEVGRGGCSFMAEGMVARSLTVAHGLGGVRKPGIGVRFLDVVELLQEVVPELKQQGHEGDKEVPPSDGVYRVAFPDEETFRMAFGRDMATGGLFVPTRYPAKLHSQIQVEVSVTGSSRIPVQVEARVVHCFDPEGPEGETNLMAGMGVEFVNLQAAVAELARLLSG